MHNLVIDMKQNEQAIADSIRPPLFLEKIAPQDFCERVIQLFQSEDVRPRSYQGLVDHELRRCDFLELPTDWDEMFHRIVLEHMQPYFERDIDPEMRTRPMVYGYPVGVGFVPHHDQVTGIEVERGRTNSQPVVGGDYTLVMFLSRQEDYDGGALYFPDLGWTFRPPPGSAIIYPTTTDYIHGVKPITRGVRYALVARFFKRREQGSAARP